MLRKLNEIVPKSGIVSRETNLTNWETWRSILKLGEMTGLKQFDKFGKLANQDSLQKISSPKNVRIRKKVNCLFCEE